MGKSGHILRDARGEVARAAHGRPTGARADSDARARAAAPSRPKPWPVFEPFDPAVFDWLFDNTAPSPAPGLTGI